MSAVDPSGASASGRVGGEGERFVDLRLLLPALVAWVVVVILQWSGSATGVVVGLAVVSGGGAAVALHRMRRLHASPGDGRHTRTAVLALTCASVALTTTCLAGHDSIRSAGSLLTWAGDRASVVVEAVADSDPRRVRAREDRSGEAEIVVLRARIVRSWLSSSWH